MYEPIFPAPDDKAKTVNPFNLASVEELVLTSLLDFIDVCLGYIDGYFVTSAQFFNGIRMRHVVQGILSDSSVDGGYRGDTR